MKCEILKRTAIALFVGGIISASATAEDTSVETAGGSFGKAINAEITKQTKAVKAELTNSIAEKADKSAVSEALNKLQTEKASLEDVTKLSENVTEGFNSIQDKVHNLQEALVGDNTENNPGLIKSVSSAVEELNDNIAKKADKATVEQNTKEIEKIKNLQGYDSLTKVENKVKELVSEKADNQALEDLKKEVKDNEEGIGELSETVSKIDDNVVGLTDAHNELLKEHNNLVEDVKAFNADYNKFTDAVHDELDEKANASDVYTKTESNSKLDAKADKQALEDLKKEVKDNEKGIGELSETVSKIDDNVVGLTDAHNELLKEHNNLVEDVKAFNADYNKFTDAVHDELDEKANASDVYTKTESNKKLDAKANVSDVYTKAESNSKLDAKANVSDVYTKAESNSKLNAKANASEVYTKTESDSKLNAKANVADVYSKTETDNKFALKADNSVVSAHTKRLDHLDNRVNKLDKDLKRGLAAQAALTGLFQPYTVGKANFTAAVGGYKSQTAVAIGTGYRYNKHVATKAGVAFTQGGAAYNVGVNFEW